MQLVVPHLFPSRRLLDAARDLHLPVLETVLSRGLREPCPGEGVEAYLCQALGIERQHDWPVAPIGLAADGGDAAGDYCLRADPVHLGVMRDHIVLAARPPDLSQADAAALAASIREHFGQAFSPSPIHPKRWYLRLPEPPKLVTTPLSVAIGRDIESLLPRGADAARFRAWLNELQMLLHEHPVNLARAARGALAVNSLWLWGGGTLPQAPRSQLRVACGEWDLQALVRFAGASLVSAPAFDGGDAADIVVIDPLSASAGGDEVLQWREVLERLDTALSALLRRSSSFTLADPMRGTACRWRKADRYKFWCRRLPLNEALR